MSQTIPNRRRHPRAYTFSRLYVLFDRVGSAVSLLDLSQEGFAVLTSPETANAILSQPGPTPVTLISDSLRLNSQAILVGHVDHGQGACRLGFSLSDVDREKSRLLQTQLANLHSILDNAEAIEIRAN